MQVPLDLKVKSLPDIPYTISYVIRKRQQIDSYSELPQNKRPPDSMIWDGSPEDIEEFFDKILDRKSDSTVKIDLSDIEG